MHNMTDHPMEYPRVSVIVPVYNAADVILRLLESLMAQTWPNLEIIIVDDGSSDQSAELVRHWIGEAENRMSGNTIRDIRLLEPPHGGVSAARNAGLKAARGEFIFFADADDEVLPEYIEGFITGKNSDFTAGGYIEQHHYERHQRSFPAREIKVDDFRKNYLALKGEVPHTFVWGNKYKKSIIDQWNLRFDETVSIGEDVLFNLMYLDRCSEIEVIEQSGYIYHDEVSGAVHRFNPDRVGQASKECGLKESFFRLENAEPLRWQYFSEAYQHGRKHVFSGSITEAQFREYAKQLKADTRFAQALQWARKNGSRDMQIVAVLFGKAITIPALFRIIDRWIGLRSDTADEKSNCKAES